MDLRGVGYRYIITKIYTIYWYPIVKLIAATWQCDRVPVIFSAIATDMTSRDDIPYCLKSALQLTIKLEILWMLSIRDTWDICWIMFIYMLIFFYIFLFFINFCAMHRMEIFLIQWCLALEHGQVRCLVSLDIRVTRKYRCLRQIASHHRP